MYRYIQEFTGSFPLHISQEKKNNKKKNNITKENTFNPVALRKAKIGYRV